MSKKLYCLCSLLILSAFVALFCGCDRRPTRTQEGMVWHTSYHITYVSRQDCADKVLGALAGVDSVLNAFNAKSELSRLNASDSLVASPMMLTVFRASQRVWRMSGGYFDPSAAPLINAYGFGVRKGETPDSAALVEMLSYVGLDKVREHNGLIVKADRRIEFNFSAIAKGYGADCVAGALSACGVDDYMVEIGGEIVVRGESPRGGKWRISVDRPIENNSSEVHDSQLVIAITNCAVATSGNYRNYREEGGRHIGHIVNPATGEPSHTDVVSATIVASDCMTADALATACMAMPADKAVQMIEREGITAFLIYADGHVYMTPTFERLVVSD